MIILANTGKACDTTSTVVCKKYYSNGQIHQVTRYKNGLRHGKWKTFDQDGHLKSKVKYKKGQRIWVFYYTNNKVTETINRKGKVKMVRDCGC